MQRSKQQALMFLLGATLVGGVLGFSVDRVMGFTATKEQRDRQNWRQFMFDDLGFTAEQRRAWESITDCAEKRREEVSAPVKAQLDSLRAAREAINARLAPQLDSVKRLTQAEMMNVLTPEQRAKYDQRLKEMRQMRLRDSTRRAEQRAANSDTTRRTPQCGAAQ